MNSFHRFHWSRLTRTLSTSYVTSNVIISPLISPGSRYFWFIDSCVGFHGKNPYGSLIVDSHYYNGPFTSLIMDSGHFSFQWHSVQQHRKTYRYSNHWQEFPHQTSLQTVCAKAKAHNTGKDSTKTQPWHELRKYIYSPARTHTHDDVGMQCLHNTPTTKTATGHHDVRHTGQRMLHWNSWSGADLLQWTNVFLQNVFFFTHMLTISHLQCCLIHNIL